MDTLVRKEEMRNLRSITYSIRQSKQVYSLGGNSKYKAGKYSNRRGDTARTDRLQKFDFLCIVAGTEGEWVE